MGLGSAATRAHLPALNQLGNEFPVALVAAADISRERRRHAESLLPDTPLFANASDMVATVGFDVLVIATQPSAHAELIVLGVSNGKHVVCEKPLVLDYSQHARVATVYRSRPDLALIPVHQYRYSPLWALISQWLSRLDRVGLPVTLEVEVERAGADPHAASNWRTNVAASGGMLADHGAHFLALAHSVSADIAVTKASSTRDPTGVEFSHARARVGSGTLRLTTVNGTPNRSTQVRASLAGLALSWRDAEAQIGLHGHTLLHWRVASLSNRDYVDSLYVCLYRDMLANLGRANWRRARTAEALAIGTAVVSMLEHTRGRVA